MAFCVKCGSQIIEGNAVCQNCGAPAGNPAPPLNNPVQPVYNAAPPTYNAAPPTYNMTPVVDPTDHTAEMNPQEIERSRVLSGLCYCGIMFMVLALVAEPNNKYVRFHVNQALCLTIGSFLVSLCMIVPFIGWLVGAVGAIMVLVFTIMGIVRGCKGRAKELPIVGKYSVLKY